MTLVPLLQLRRMLRRRSSSDVSISLVLLLPSFSLWVSYKIASGAIALVIPNTVAAVIAGLTIAVAVRLRHGESDDTPGSPRADEKLRWQAAHHVRPRRMQGSPGPTDASPLRTGGAHPLESRHRWLLPGAGVTTLAAFLLAAANVAATAFTYRHRSLAYAAASMDITDTRSIESPVGDEPSASRKQ